MAVDPEDNCVKKVACFPTCTLPVTVTFSRSQTLPSGTTRSPSMVLSEIVVVHEVTEPASAAGTLPSKKPSAASVTMAKRIIRHPQRILASERHDTLIHAQF